MRSKPARSCRTMALAASVVASLAWSCARATAEQAPATQADASRLTTNVGVLQEPAATVPPSPRAKPVVPPPPSEIGAAKTYAVLQGYCAQCHQTGLLKTPAAGGLLGNILDVGALAGNRRLVRPGEPDASPLYEIMQRRHWPLDVASLLPGTNWPRANEQQALRSWIEQVPRTANGCNDREPIRGDSVVAAVTQMIEAEPPESRSDIRVVSLTEVFDACADDAEMAAYRDGVTTLLNSLSWAEKPFTLKPFGPSGTLLLVRLKDLDWVPAHWQRLAAIYPYANMPGTRLPDEVRAMTGTTVPLVRGDWLVATALNAPLFYDLTGMPERLADLERILNVDASRLAYRGAGIRIGLTRSEITTGHRVLERLPGKSGPMWRAYDLAADTPLGNLREHPIGPEAVAGAPAPFRAEAIRVMVPGPNGYPKLALFDGQGRRIPTVPDAVASPALRGASVPSGMLGCYGCHRAGPIGGKDEVRALAASDALSLETRTAIRALHPEQPSIDRLLAEDRSRRAGPTAAESPRATEPAAGDTTPAATTTAVATAAPPNATAPAETIAGLDPLTALAAAHLRSATLEQGAREFGVPVATFRRLIDSLPPEERLIGRRLQHTAIPRVELDRVLVAMAGSRSPLPVTTGSAASPTADARLTLWTNQHTYRQGDTATFSAHTSTNCYLTLIGVDSRGIATVLFPNDFETDNQLKAGQTIKVPSDGSPYQFRFTRPGRETVVGVCLASPRPLGGIEHDFERQRFTTLGSWRNFLGELAVRAEEASTSQDATTAQTKGRPRGRARDKDKEPASPAPTLADPHTRMVITYEVK